METLQTRFLRLLDSRADERGLDLVISYNYSNCGLLHFMEDESFIEKLVIPFDVQSNLVTLGWMSQNKKMRDVFPDRPNPRFAGFEAKELDEAIDCLLEAAGAPLPV